MKIYLEKYHSDTCGNHDYTNIELKENFTGVRAIKSIRHKDEQDFVFVVPPLNNCDVGESYFFLDSSLPRLLTDSFCCHSRSEERRVGKECRLQCRSVHV